MFQEFYKGFRTKLFCSEFIPCALILLVRNPLWVCGREAPLSAARSPHAQRLQGAGEGSEAAPGTATSIVPLLRAENLPVPARPR